MSTLQVSNVHLESTGNNRIQYDGSNTFTMVAGGANVATINSTSISVGVSTTLNGANVVTVSDTQTLTNKTLTSPAINVGSDTTGDLYYRTAGGAFARLGIGSADQVLTVASGLPSWAAASGGLNLLETVQPPSDVTSITYATTTFTSYERVMAAIIFEGDVTPTGYGLDVEQAGSWRTVFSVTDPFPDTATILVVNIFNVSDADSTGVVFALGSGSVDTSVFGRTNTNSSGWVDQVDPTGGYSSYGGAITGVRWTVAGGEFQGDSGNRAIAKLYAA